MKLNFVNHKCSILGQDPNKNLKTKGVKMSHTYTKGKLLLGFVPKDLVDYGKTISKVDFLKAIEENLKDYDQLSYEPENPDNFHTDYILRPVVKKVIENSDPVALKAMFNSLDKSIVLAWDDTNQVYWLLTFDSFENGKPNYINHSIHTEPTFRNGLSKMEVAGRLWQYAQSKGKYELFGNFENVLKQFEIDVKPISEFSKSL